MNDTGKDHMQVKAGLNPARLKHILAYAASYTAPYVKGLYPNKRRNFLHRSPYIAGGLLSKLKIYSDGGKLKFGRITKGFSILTAWRTRPGQRGI